ncbi:MAG: hypothetical protein GY711_26505 [bacterium]|nr:hypothetical protein [bacterium]
MLTARAPKRRALCLGFPALALLIAPAAFGHGGAYRGPSDSAPPGSGGNAPPPAPSGGSGSSGGASSGGGGAGGAPGSGPGNCGTLGGHVAPRPGAPNPASSADLSVWQMWWGFNQDSFLDVKGAIHAMDVLPGSDDGFLGAGGFLRDALRPGEEQVRQLIVPALLRALKNERDNDVVSGSLVALAKIGDPPRKSRDGRSRTSLADVVRPFLEDPNQEIAETAAVCLGILGSAGSAPHLASLLVDDAHGRKISGNFAGVPLRTRAFAAYGLGLIGHRVDDDELRRSIARTLFRTLDGAARKLSTPDVAVACATALGLVPLPVVDVFDPEQPGEPWSSRQAAVAHLAALVDDGSRRDVVRAHAPVATARLLAGSGLDAARGRVAVLWTEALLEERAPVEVLWSLAFALGSIGDADKDLQDKRLRAALTESSLRGKNRELRQFALIALAQAASRVGSGEAPLAGVAPARQHILALLNRGGSSIRPWAALASGIMGHALRKADAPLDATCDIALLVSLRGAKAPREVGAYAIAAAMRGIEEAAPLLVAKLDEVADDDTRGYVALGLGMLGDPLGLEPVQTVVRQSKYRPALLRQAAISLGLLGDKAIVPDLIGMLRKASSLSAQASIAYGLGAIGDSRSVAPLIEMLEDETITPRARAFAAVSLGIVADKEPRPWNAKLAAGINYRARTATLTDQASAGILDIL